VTIDKRETSDTKARKSERERTNIHLSPMTVPPLEKATEVVVG
jgi:hypothetical protein